MKKLLLCVCIFSSCSAQLIIVDNTAILQQTDILTLTKEVFKGISAWRIPLLLPRAAGFEKQFFAILNRMPVKPKNKTRHGVLYNGKGVPKIMEQWTVNALNSKQTLSMVNRYIQSTVKDGTQQQLYKNLARMSFDPAVAPKLFKPDNQLMNTLARCKRNGHKIILATNWNAQTLKALTNKFRSIYRIFDDSYISSPTRSKPQKQFFQPIFEKYGVKPADCISIETEQKFASAAQKLGMKAIRYTGNISTLQQRLRALKAL